MSTDVTLRHAHEQRNVIWNADNDSAKIDLAGGGAGLLIELPDAFLGSALTYKVERLLSPGNFHPVHDQGVILTDTVSKNAVNVLSADKLFGVKTLVIVSDQAETTTAKLHMVT